MLVLWHSMFLSRRLHFTLGSRLNGLGKVVEDGLSVWPLPPTLETQMKLLVSCFGLAQLWGMKQQMKVFPTPQPSPLPIFPSFCNSFK